MLEASLSKNSVLVPKCSGQNVDEHRSLLDVLGPYNTEQRERLGQITERISPLSGSNVCPAGPGLSSSGETLIQKTNIDFFDIRYS